MLGTILFLILALIAVASAIGMLTSTNAVHAALFLVINFMCVALFYLGLSAPFLAMVQITVYAGAIMVLFLFVIMLLGAEKVTLSSRLRWQTPLALMLVVLLVAVTAFILFNPQIELRLSAPPPSTAEVSTGNGTAYTFGSPHSVGSVLFKDYLLPFELVGVLLLVAMIGVVVLAKGELERPSKGRRITETPPTDD